MQFMNILNLRVLFLFFVFLIPHKIGVSFELTFLLSETLQHRQYTFASINSPEEAKQVQYWKKQLKILSQNCGLRNRLAKHICEALTVTQESIEVINVVMNRSGCKISAVFRHMKAKHYDHTITTEQSSTNPSRSTNAAAAKLYTMLSEQHIKTTLSRVIAEALYLENEYPVEPIDVIKIDGNVINMIQKMVNVDDDMASISSLQNQHPNDTQSTRPFLMVKNDRASS